MLYRVFAVSMFTYGAFYPDEQWHTTQVAYKLVYGSSEGQEVILPWEWTPEWRLRNLMNPMILAVPLQLAKTLGFDTPLFVRNYPYVLHLVMLWVGDTYFWCTYKKHLGKNSARFALIFFITVKQFNFIYSRYFINSYEVIFNLIGFYYYLEAGKALDKPTCIMTGIISAIFIIRYTACIPWVPLLVVKLIEERNALLSFIKAFFVVSIPVIGFLVAIDSWYFGSLTLAFWQHILQTRGESHFFGTDVLSFYVFQELPYFLHVGYPILAVGTVYYVYECWNKR
jgi:hypothetical protein